MQVFSVAIESEDPEDIGTVDFYFGVWRDIEEAEAFCNQYTELRHRYLEIVLPLEEEEIANHADMGLEEDEDLLALLEEARVFFVRYCNEFQRPMLDKTEDGRQQVWSLLESVYDENERRAVNLALIIPFELQSNEI